jgi:hypothetical protein
MTDTGKKIVGLAPEYKETFSTLANSKLYPSLLKFLKTQQNNIAILEWARVKSSDPNIAIHKAYFEGQYDWVKTFILILEQAKKGEDK